MNTDQNSFTAIVPIPEPSSSMMLGIRSDSERVINVEFLAGCRQPLVPKDSIAIEAMRQIKSYFSDPGWRFDLPIQFSGSQFQIRVWQALRKIKPGETISYGDLAAQLNSSARAVGNACRRNPLPIIVPCHRVVSKSGLGGFSGQREGYLVNLKQWLIERESDYVC